MANPGEGQQFFPAIFDANLEAEQPYFVMEHFENGCLSAEMVRNWLLKDKVDFYLALIRAVSFANLRGVVHRDLKPQNILVSKDQKPKVTDFGICYVDQDGERQTLMDEAVGSFKFMAPEMEDGRANDVDQRSDIYSLGKIAYWLFSDGVIYNRERHREEEFDLTKQGSETWRYFLNDYLDRTTNPIPGERPSESSSLISEFDIVRCAVFENVRYLDLRVEQQCSFCGMGTYRIHIDSSAGNRNTDVSNFGFTPVGNPLWLVLVCDSCGNVQSFRKDLAREWKWR